MAMADGGGLQQVLDMSNGSWWHIMEHWSSLSKDYKYYNPWSSMSTGSNTSPKRREEQYYNIDHLYPYTRGGIKLIPPIFYLKRV
jgi:hypothetical protein